MSICGTWTNHRLQHFFWTAMLFAVFEYKCMHSRSNEKCKYLCRIYISYTLEMSVRCRTGIRSVFEYNCRSQVPLWLVTKDRLRPIPPSELLKPQCRSAAEYVNRMLLQSSRIMLLLAFPLAAFGSVQNAIGRRTWSLFEYIWNMNTGGESGET